MTRFKHICKVCGKEFTTIGCNSKYCSKECHEKGIKKNQIIKEHKVCPICGNEFDSNLKKYCCKECSEIARKIKMEEANQRYRDKKQTSEDGLCIHRDCKYRESLGFNDSYCNYIGIMFEARKCPADKCTRYISRKVVVKNDKI